jgi:hypothetical protein
MKLVRSCVDLKNVWKLDHESIPDDITFQVLLGGTMGDGHIRNIRSGFRYEEKHCPHQVDYGLWKAKMLSFFKPTTRPYPYNNCKRKPPSVAIELVTPFHPILSELKAKIYDRRNGRCVKSFFPDDLASRMSFLGLFVWYLDDGTIGRGQKALKENRKPYPSISALGLYRHSLKSAVDIINKNLGLTLVASQSGHVLINKKNREKLFPIWTDLAKKYRLPACMYYKLGFARKGA